MDSLNIRIAIEDRVLDFVDRAGRTHELIQPSSPACCNVLEVDDLIFQLTRGKHSIYTSGI